jgi:hypothetical protein
MARKLWHLQLDACLGPTGPLTATSDDVAYDEPISVAEPRPRAARLPDYSERKLMDFSAAAASSAGRRAGAARPVRAHELRVRVRGGGGRRRRRVCAQERHQAAALQLALGQLEAQELRQRGDVALAAADLLDDPEPAGMAENREHLGKFLAGDFSERHLGFLSEECLL